MGKGFSWVLFFLARIAATRDVLQGECWARVTNFYQALTDKGERDLIGRLDPTEPCNRFSDADRQMMALLLLECHSKHRSLVWTSSCNFADLKHNYRPDQVTRCLVPLSQADFHLYVEFWNHLESTCFHVHAALWQAQTDQIVRDIQGSAYQAIVQMNEAAMKQAQLIEGQKLSLEAQEGLYEDSLRLRGLIESGQFALQDAFLDIRKEVESERARFLESFGDIYDAFLRLLSFQKYLKDQLFNLQSGLIYVFLTIMTFYLTASKRTGRCRVSLYLLWTALAMAEMLLTKHSFYILRVLESLWPYCYQLIRWSSIHGVLYQPKGMENLNVVFPSCENEITLVRSLISTLRTYTIAVGGIVWCMNALRPFKTATALDDSPLALRDCQHGKYSGIIKCDPSLKQYLEEETGTTFLARVCCNALTTKLNNTQL